MRDTVTDMKAKALTQLTADRIGNQIFALTEVERSSAFWAGEALGLAQKDMARGLGLLVGLAGDAKQTLREVLREDGWEYVAEGSGSWKVRPRGQAVEAGIDLGGSVGEGSMPESWDEVATRTDIDDWFVEMGMRLEIGRTLVGRTVSAVS